MGLREDVLSRTNALVNNCLVHKRVRSSPYGLHPTKGGDGGDDCLWLGLLASVGAANAVEGLLACQSQGEHGREGMFYRNPERRFNNNVEYGENYFSRDMGLGVILGLISVPKDRANYHGKKWIDFIMSQWPCLLKKPWGGGCWIRYPFRKLAPWSDSRVDVTNAYWGTIGRAFRYHGLALNNQMNANLNVDDMTHPAEVNACPLGYQLHLKAVAAYIRMLTNQSESTRKYVADRCYQRLPSNLFYKVLSQKKATDDDMRTFLSICPDPNTFQPQDYWCWDQENVVEHYNKCCGWDMAFLGYLMAKRLY